MVGMSTPAENLTNSHHAQSHSQSQNLGGGDDLKDNSKSNVYASFGDKDIFESAIAKD